MKVGCALTIGGLKPVAFIPILKELERRNLRQYIVGYSGSSGGSIWAAMAAFNYQADALMEAALSITSKSIWEDPSLGKVVTGIWRTIISGKVMPGFTGFMEGKKVLDWLFKRFGLTTFDNLPPGSKPLYIVAYDINESRGCLFGPKLTAVPVAVMDAVRASIAIPFGFSHHSFVVKSQKENPNDYKHGFWDGGIICQLPLEPFIHFPDHGLTEPVDLIIAIDAAGVTDGEEGTKFVSINDLSAFDLLRRAVSAITEENNRMNLLTIGLSGIPLVTYKVRYGASMSDPGKTIPIALAEAERDAIGFVNEVEKVMNR